MLLLQAIAGHDGADATSVDRGDEPQQRTTDIQRSSLAGMKCAVPREYLSSEGLDPRIRQSCLETIDLMRSLGAEIEEIDIPLLKYVIPLYYVIVPAEVSTNMARFDGIRYGLQRDTLDYDDIFAYYASIRHDGFGDEVKRRIMLGSYVLSAGHYDAYYHKAQQVRQLLKRTFDNIFADYDAIL